jgi:4-hydroxythreonine-4-phosphate dehydrogenase
MDAARRSGRRFLGGWELTRQKGISHEPAAGGLAEAYPGGKDSPPVIALTAGDPAGIGPEIIAHLFSTYRPAHSRTLILCSPKVIRPWVDQFGWSCPIVSSLKELHQLEETISFDICIFDTGCKGVVPPGKCSRTGGMHAGKAVDLAIRLATKGVVQAIVTAPLSKEALNRAGYHYNGHTEMLAHNFASPDCQMMMVYQGLRVVPLTRHLPIAEVAGQISEERILACLSVVNRSLEEQFGVESPRIAVCALNPHSGEGGMLGHEEQQVIQPALRKATKRKIRAYGPFAADSLFQSAPDGPFDAYISMYHDQGLIPFKLLARKRGVNVTVGLPVVRTSVDHGVAYDIAGKGRADPASLQAAYILAEELVKNRPKSAV